MPMYHGVNKKSAPIVSTTPPPLPEFQQVYYFTRNTLSTFFCSDEIIARYNALSK